MYAGCGYAGDFAGDPLEWVASGFLAWVGSDRENIRAVWSGDPDLPADSTWTTYLDGELQDRAAESAEDFAVATAGVVPNVAAVAVAPGVGDDDYDPLGSEDAANISDVKTLFAHTLRGQYRIANAALDVYELYRGVDAEPDFDAAPYESFATLPHTTPAQDVGHTYYFVLRKRNVHNLSSQNVASWSVKVGATGADVTEPSAPAEWALAAAAAGAARVTASYDYLTDGTAARGDTWAVWITADGSTPNPSGDPDYTETMVLADGVAKLDYTDGGHSHGATLKALVRVRRDGETPVDSQNSTVQTATADATGPAAPAGAATFHGGASKQG